MGGPCVGRVRRRGFGSRRRGDHPPRGRGARDPGPRTASVARRRRPRRAGRRPASQPGAARDRRAKGARLALRPPRAATGRRRAAPRWGAAAPMSRFREEIAEQVAVAERLLELGAAAASTIGERIRETPHRGFVIAARGSSDNAALYAKYLFGVRNRALVTMAAPSLFTHYAHAPRLEGQCVIGVSQSGESPDVIAVVEEGRRQGSLTLAITNEGDSKLARAAETVVPMYAGT